MKKQFNDVSSRYGAPMGRPDFVHNKEAVVHLFRVNFIDGDYDDGGAYWGGNEPLYCARDQEGEVQTFIRAGTWGEAKTILLADWPDMKVMPYEVDLDDMVRGYLECALWSSHGMGGDDFEFLDEVADIDDFHPDAVLEARVDCDSFLDLCLAEGVDPTAGMRLEGEQIGRDFWLTRNGHGAGFWDRGLGETGEALSRLAETYGETHPYMGYDGKVYFE